ncbi:MAG TPA: MarR family winged helix-turn-helix transcriptional regulator [Mycobacterium sp.]|nr:MarR family winged helix-turn-helix transcriptional regulator [Mycobacterium sp.]
MSDLEGAGVALFRLVRFWSRRWVTTPPDQVTAEMARVRDIMVLEAVDAAMTKGQAVSVADVAHELGIDHSGASRMVAEASRNGYLVREAAPDDARRATLALTKDGLEVLAAAHDYQDGVFAELTAGWPAKDAARFATYLRRLADQ